MKVIGIGETVIDKTIVVKRHGNISQFVHIQEDIGGPVPAGLLLLRKLGVECEFATSLGDDAHGRQVKNKFAEQGVALHVTPRMTTKRHMIIVDHTTGQRDKLRGSKSNAPVSLPSPGKLREFDLILVDRHEREAYYEILQHKNPRAKVIIDPSTELSDFTKSMFVTATHPIIPIETLVQLECRSLRHSLALLHKIAQKPFVVTLGRLGSLLHKNREVTYFPPHHIAAIDSNGAGDVFRGAFAYGCLQGWKVEKCIQYANCAAALQCTRRGNISALPSRHAIDYHSANATRHSLTLTDVERYFTQLQKEAAMY